MRYCTRPLRGALRTLSSISAWSRSVVARAASMAACASSDLRFGCCNGSLCPTSWDWAALNAAVVLLYLV